VNVTAKNCHSIYKIVAHNDETLSQLQATAEKHHINLQFHAKSSLFH